MQGMIEGFHSCFPTDLLIMNFNGIIGTQQEENVPLDSISHSLTLFSHVRV